MPAKTVAEQILDIVQMLRQDVEQMKEMIGEEGMESLNRRLTRLETKATAMAKGEYKDDQDGMDQPARER